MASRNRHRIRAIATAIAALMMAAGTAAAESQSGGIPGDWLSRYAGARTVGLGGAFVATADQPLGALWNPAGLVHIPQNQADFETSQLFEGTSLNGLSFVIPARTFPTLGVSVISLRSGGFERTNELNESLGEFKESDLAFLLSASKAVNPRLSLGANVRVVRNQVEDFDATGVGFDLGAMYQALGNLRIGASVLNVGGPSLSYRAEDETFPLELRGGAAFTFFAGKGMVTAEVDHRTGNTTTFHAGTEMWFHEMIGLRAGYYEKEPAGGFSYIVTPTLSFDYGVSDHELGLMHRFAVSYRFGGFFAHSAAYPSVFSPIGENSVTKFEIKARTKAEAQEWRLDIVDKHNEVVRAFGGKGVPPAHVMWDGKNDAGLTLPDGEYRYRLTVLDTEGRTLRTDEKKVRITTTGPQGDVPVIVD